VNQVSIEHHVFSSDGGYTTTFASPSLGRAEIQRLEDFAGAAQSAFNTGLSKACFSFDQARIAASCTFAHGADHVGRRRLCTHTTLLPASVRTLESFNPASPVANLFMTPEVPAERPGPYLAPHWILLEDNMLDNARQHALVELDGYNQAILAGLLAPARTLVIAGDPADCYRRLGSAAWLLPREIRCNLFFRTGTWQPAEARAFGPVTAILVTRSERLQDYPVGEFVPVNLYEPPTVGPSHPHVRLLNEMNSGVGGHRRLKTLLDLLTAFPGPAQPTLDQESCLARGYQLAEPMFLAEDALDIVTKGAPIIIKAIFPLAKSGRQALAARLVEVLEQALQHTDRSVQIDALSTLEAQLNESFQQHGEQFGEQLARYRRRLTEAVTVNRAPP
jgi:hypothetical protein